MNLRKPRPTTSYPNKSRTPGLCSWEFTLWPIMYTLELVNNKILLLLLFPQFTHSYCYRHLVIIRTTRAGLVRTLIMDRLRSAQNRGKGKDRVNVCKLFPHNTFLTKFDDTFSYTGVKAGLGKLQPISCFCK